MMIGRPVRAIWLYLFFFIRIAILSAQSIEIDVKHISLDLQFDWEKKQVFGTALIKLVALNTTTIISLDATQLNIHSVSYSNGTALKFRNGKDTVHKLEIELTKPLKAGEEVTFLISYNSQWINATDPNAIWGSTGTGVRFFEPSSTEPARRRQIWSMGEGQSNSRWFPCNDVPGDLLTTEFKATVDNNFTVISNGSLIDRTLNPNGTISYSYKTDLPYPNHKIAFVVGEYLDLKSNHGKIKIHNYSYPDEREATQATVVRLPDMMRFYSELTAHDFPYLEYSQVFVQELPWGRATAGFAAQTENMVDDFGTHNDFFYLWDMLEAESLAGQWFGNYLSCKDWNHYWLDKAFSRYLSCLYNEYKNGSDEFLLYQLTFDQSNYFSDWNSGYKRPLVAKKPFDINEQLNSNYPNSRGALVLHMLRKELGEDNWRKVLRHYVKANGGKAVITSDLQKSVLSTTGQNLDWFFEQWVYRTGHPVFLIHKNYDALNKQLILILEQVQQPDSMDTSGQALFFRGKMKIEVDEKIETVLINASRENKFMFKLDKEPKLINVDFERSWIAELKFEKNLEDYSWQLQHSRDILAQQRAITELVKLAMDKECPPKDKATVCELLRNFSVAKKYWRIRNMALASLHSVLKTNTANAPFHLDSAIEETVFTILKNDTAWLRASALKLLGESRDPKFQDVYLQYLNDKSDRVVNTAAIALGKCKSPKAFDALIKLKDKSSWKNQSLISSLNGLRELGDKRAIDFALGYVNASELPHWTLSTIIWDHRLTAIETLIKLEAGDKAYPLVASALEKAKSENNTNDIFYHLLQISMLGDARGLAIFDGLKISCKENAGAITAITNLEEQFNQSLKKNKSTP